MGLIVALRAAELVVMLLAGLVVTVGLAVVEYVTVNVSVDMLLTASFAVTVIRLEPATREILVIDHDVVPIAVPEVLLAELNQVTLVTPTLSEAVPERLIVD